MSEDKLTCGKCQANLEPKQLSLRYMGRGFNVEVPRCPVCGLVYLSRELVEGRMAEVEENLEGK